MIPWGIWWANLRSLWATPAQRAEVITLAILVAALLLMVVLDRLGRWARVAHHQRVIAVVAQRLAEFRKCLPR